MREFEDKLEDAISAQQRKIEGSKVRPLLCLNLSNSAADAVRRLRRAIRSKIASRRFRAFEARKRLTSGPSVR